VSGCGRAATSWRRRWTGAGGAVVRLRACGLRLRLELEDTASDQHPCGSAVGSRGVFTFSSQVFLWEDREGRREAGCMLGWWWPGRRNGTGGLEWNSFVFLFPTLRACGLRLWYQCHVTLAACGVPASHLSVCVFFARTSLYLSIYRMEADAILCRCLVFPFPCRVSFSINDEGRSMVVPDPDPDSLLFSRKKRKIIATLFDTHGFVAPCAF
jgi:hypothetical protein